MENDVHIISQEELKLLKELLNKIDPNDKVFSEVKENISNLGKDTNALNNEKES